MRIVESPCHGVEHPGYTVLRDAPTEQRIALEGAECVVLNLGVRWGRALSDEIEIYVGTDWGRVEQDEPDVYAEFGLEERIGQFRVILNKLSLGELLVLLLGIGYEVKLTMPSLFAGIPFVKIV